MRYQGMIEFIDIVQKYPNNNQPVILTFQNERRQTWVQNADLIFKGGRAPQPKENLLDLLGSNQASRSLAPSSYSKKNRDAGREFILDKKIQRINLAFGEASFNFYCCNRFMASVINENLGNWLGFESLIE